MAENGFFGIKKGLNVKPATLPVIGNLGDIAFDSLTNSFKQWNGSVWTDVAGGSGGINYLNAVSKGDSVTGFVVSKNTVAAAIPDNGFITTGTNITITSSTSLPLRSTNSLLLTKDAANRQGEQVYYDFLIDPADQGKMVSFTFDYAIASGTYATGDLIVYFYDVTNGTFIEPAPMSIQNHTLPSQTFRTEFQTHINSVSYRMIMHVASTSTAAYSLKFDNLSLGPNVFSSVSPTTDLTAYPPILSNATNATVTKSTWAQDGDRLIVKGLITWSGAGGGAAFTVSLPPGLSIDISKISSAVQNSILGYGQWFDNGTIRNGVGVMYNTTTTVQFEDFTTSSGVLVGTGFAAGDTLSYAFDVPILGWSSGVQTSNLAGDGRVVSARMTSTDAKAFTYATPAAMTWSATTFDSHGMADLTNERFNILVAGDYQIDASLLFNSIASTNNDAVILNARVNGSTSYLLSATGFQNGNTQFRGINGSTTIRNLKSGDYIEIIVTQNIVNPTLTTYVDYNQVSIFKLSGSSAIAASDDYNMRACITSAVNVVAGLNQIAFPVISWDTHGSWSGNNTFTAQSPGKFRVKAQVTFPVTVGTSTNFIYLTKSGSIHSINYDHIGDFDGYNVAFVISDTIRLLAGQTIAVVVQNGNGTIALDVTDGANFVTIERIGNY